MTNAEVVCVDGVRGVEAVVVRYTRTGRQCAVNTSAFLSCDRSTHPPRARMGDTPLENRRIEPERGDMLETTLELSGSRSPRMGCWSERQGFGTDADRPQ